MIDRRTLIVGAGAALALRGCGSAPESRAAVAPPLRATVRSTRLIAAARRQVGVTLRYDSGYARIGFPGGDVPSERGVCTDVVIRAYRAAFGLDLQALVNRDMRAAFAAYPKLWGLAGPDPNIDHRRVPNLAAWLKRRHAALPVPPMGRPGSPATSSRPWWPAPVPISAWCRTARAGEAR
jgi:uncharacterized protein YijF (DUF1287 family)